MNHFDLRTAYAVVSLLYLLLPFGAWAILAGRRSSALVYWTRGSAAIGAAIFLIGLRGLIPDELSMTLANLLLFGGFLATWQALRLEDDNGYPRLRLALLLVGFIVIYELVRISLDDARPRFLYVLVAYLVLMGATAWQAAQLARNEQVRSPYWIAAGLLVLMSALLQRFSLIIADDRLPRGIALEAAPSQPDLSAVLLPLAAILTAIMGQIGYLGLYLERSRREQQQAVAQRASLEVDRAAQQTIADLDRQRSLGEMSASLSAELRQPLAEIREIVAATRTKNTRGNPDRDQLLAGLDRCITEIKRASTVIEAIRDYIRPAKFQPGPLDLAEVIHKLIALVRPEAEARQVAVRLQLPPAPLRVMGDALLLSQALFHLYRNAIQAMEHAPRRELFVHANVLQKAIIVSVCDTGPGMSETMRMQIGRPFTREDGRGLGLGLAIASSILHLHEGQLMASPALGGGLCIDLTLPALPAGSERGT